MISFQYGGSHVELMASLSFRLLAAWHAVQVASDFFFSDSESINSRLSTTWSVFKHRQSGVICYNGPARPTSSLGFDSLKKKINCNIHEMSCSLTFRASLMKSWAALQNWTCNALKYFKWTQWKQRKQPGRDENLKTHQSCECLGPVRCD